MEIYMDNAATTRVYDEAADTVSKVMRSDFGNPSSLHTKGLEAEHYIRRAREIFAGILKADEKELIFTSGGTESNNTAILGAAAANSRRGHHIITTQIEHASVSEPLRYLEEHGFEVTRIPVDRFGVIDINSLKEAVRDDTILVSVMCVNNEIGTVEPINAVSAAVKSVNPDTLIHVDAIQGFGKMALAPGRLGIDMMSVSGHKFHGPKGTGLLWVRDKVRIDPMILGGGQQKAMRSGTENVPGIAGMAAAAEIEYTDLEAKTERLYGLREYFINEIEKFDGAVVNGGHKKGSVWAVPDDYTDIESEDVIGECCAAPHIVSVSFEDIRAEVLLHALAEEGIYVSSGSACSSNHPSVSSTLKAIGVKQKYLDSTVRFSFSFDTTKEEIDICLEKLAGILPVLRRYTPGGRKRRQ